MLRFLLMLVWEALKITVACVLFVFALVLAAGMLLAFLAWVAILIIYLILAYVPLSFVTLILWLVIAPLSLVSRKRLSLATRSYHRLWGSRAARFYSRSGGTLDSVKARYIDPMLGWMMILMSLAEDLLD